MAAALRRSVSSARWEVLVFHGCRRRRRLGAARWRRGPAGIDLAIILLWILQIAVGVALWAKLERTRVPLYVREFQSRRKQDFSGLSERPCIVSEAKKKAVPRTKTAAELTSSRLLQRLSPVTFAPQALSQGRAIRLTLRQAPTPSEQSRRPWQRWRGFRRYQTLRRANMMTSKAPGQGLIRLRTILRGLA